MRLPSHRILALALTMTVLWFTHPAWAQPSPDYVPGEILVKWERALEGLDKAMARDYVAGLTVREFSEIGWEHIEIDPTMEVQTAIQKMLQQPGVIAAEPNYILRAFLVPDDFRFGLQWALQNTGQTVDGDAGTAGADISATTAWDLRTTSPNVVVAVIDSGITLNHSDLSANLWVNTGETAGNGIDDDGNGKIDDVNGWDFVNDDNDPTDDETNLHGTHGSGIIGAKGNDASGIAGITWTVQLMTLKFLDASGSGTTANAISAIEYAQAEGAQIINASWGSSSFSQALKDAIDAFSGLFVAAAGNDGTDNDVTPHYPACFTSTNIVAVAATDQNDALASFSNFGTTCVDLAAPGVNILSDSSVGFVSFLDGTSFSAPMVSGVAALLKAREPNLSTAEIRSAILDNVDAIVGLSGSGEGPSGSAKVATGGRLNARAALVAVEPLAPSDLAGTAASATQVDLTWTDNSAGETGYEVQRKTGSGSFTTLANLAANSTSHADTTATEATAHTYRVRAFKSGTNSGFSNEVSVTTPPAAPTGLTATADSSSAITLTWTDNSAGETGYEVQRKTGSGAFAAVTTTAANVTTHTDSGLAAATTFTYRVRATGTGGNSSFSAEASATTKSEAGGGGGGGGCFIATAAYGSPLAAQVQGLRAFRDQVLLQAAPGRWLVRTYYRLSPPVADVIAAHDWMRATTRAALRPVIWWADLALTAPGLAWTFLVLGTGALVISASVPFVVWRARRARRSSP